MHSAELGAGISLVFAIPFVGMLLCIAICPLVIPEKWEKWRWLFVLFWSLLFLIPFALTYNVPTMVDQLLESLVGDYLTFIVLLFGLFCVAGNICLEGDLAGTPKTNVILLLIGTVLASWIGTTGASMVMIRPILRANRWRSKCVQTVVFFIFLVSNIGGCLTPIGDPPLLMGFMRGVPFTWELQHLLPIMVLNVVLLLAIYFVMDQRAYRKDLAAGRKPLSGGAKLRLSGGHNIVFMLVIVLAVVLSGVLPGMPLFQDATGNVLGIHIFGSVSLSYPTLIEIVMILAAAFLSFKTTRKDVRTKNNFTWGAIEEVAVLFIGIFITMIPALLFLKAHGADLGLTEPWQMFWATGALSSFLDNTPTYLVFMTTAGALGAAEGVVTTVGTIAVPMLIAISCGAVFMGANTYIGNAPNFMVKSIADENGVKMPSFFGYMAWSVGILIPVFLIDTLLFFL
ncbi:MAG: sodium:proton antiporter [Clostridiales bacterium]|nr:sodium:proton antiporter [Clostridiales bacterium]MDY4037526.1 sodium:proton antiporter [Candidatus Pseudoscilispira sp.]